MPTYKYTGPMIRRQLSGDPKAEAVTLIDGKEYEFAEGALRGLMSRQRPENLGRLTLIAKASKPKAAASSSGRTSSTSSGGSGSSGSSKKTSSSSTSSGS